MSMHKGGDEMSQIWRKSNWKTSYVIKLYADGVGAPEVDGDAVLVRKERLQNKWYKFNTLSELIFESFSMLFRIRAGVLCSSIS